MPTKQSARVPFLGLQLATFSPSGFVHELVQSACHRTSPFKVGYLNAATTNLCCEQQEIRNTFNQLDCLYADGQAVVWAAGWLGHPIPERVNAADFTLEFFQACAQDNLSVALVGGRPARSDAPCEAERFAAHFTKMVNDLNVTFIHHGYFPPDKADGVRKELEAADPDIVLLGMGTPRQENLALAWSEAPDANPRVWWCVGALFEYYAGTRLRAPVWVRRIGMEWAVRLVLEPGRLWRRYVIGNPKFIWRVWRAKSKQPRD